MGYPLDEAAQNASLDAFLGDNHASTIPDDFELAIFNAHPLLGGTELDSTGGYARAAVANDSATWPDAASGQKVANPISLPTPTDAWSDTGTHWVLFDAADSTTRWFCGRLLDELAVDGTETALATQPIAYWNTTSL